MPSRRRVLPRGSGRLSRRLACAASTPSFTRWSALLCGAALAATAGCSPTSPCADAGAPDTGMGAAGGGGGAPSLAALAVGCGDPPPGALDYLDDMEDGDARILGRDGRSGSWYTYHDQTQGTLDPDQNTTPVMETIPGQRCGTSTKAMRVTGSGFSDWGAGFGFDLRYGTGDAGVPMELPYDASRFRGFTFWGRIGDTSIDTIRVSIGDKWSRPDGGVCTVDPAAGPNACYDPFGKSFTLTSTWQRFSIDFGQLQQESFGLPRPALDAGNVMTFEVAIPAASPVFDIWIDDVAFYQ